MRRRTAPLGFSLVELLVVISIIALLVGIALPAMSRVRQSARIAQCKSNLGQVGSAMHLYLQDNRQVLPATNDNDAGATTLNYASLLGNVGEDAPPYNKMGANVLPENRLLNPYLASDYEVAKCPLDRGEQGEYYGTQGAAYRDKTAWQKYGTSYIFPSRSNSQMGLTTGSTAVYRLRAGWWHPEGHRMTEIERPAKKLLVADQIMMPTWDSLNPVHHWHNSASSKDQLKVSGLFADGHADTVTKMDTGSGAKYNGTPNWGPGITNTTDYTQVELYMDGEWGYY